ncbi:MAG TPA: PDZ domain-containing protein [Candidatus Binataceae bacterium]|nr:PDZ domain-containing protein [Candidatus Binataceae bacterium]
MGRWFLLAGCPLLALTLAAGELNAADDTAETQAASVAAQPAPSASAPDIHLQPGDAKTLELSPQPAATSAAPEKSAAGDQHQFKPEEDIAALNRNFHPRLEDNFPPAYLGAVVEYTTQCYLGMEEHGLEVVSLDPSGPAAQAGLRSRTGASALGVVGATAGLMLGPVELIVAPLLERSGALGTGGDLIVAIDDVRVRDARELQRAVRHLKPGDTVYLTVIRPLHDRGHQTMRVAVRLDEWRPPVANAAAPSAGPGKLAGP